MEQMETALQKERQLQSHHTQVHCAVFLSEITAYTPFQHSYKMLHMSFWWL